METKLPIVQKQIDKNDHSGDIFSALLLIALGTILLFNNLNILPWSIWEIILRFWPILLIIGGIQAIFGRSPLIRFVISLLGAAIVGIILAVSVASVNQDFDQWLKNKLPEIIKISNKINSINFNNNEYHTENITVTGDNFPTVENSKIEMNFGAGNFIINDEDSNNFLNIEANYYGDSGKPIINTKTVNHEIDINIEMKEPNDSFFIPSHRLTYLITLGKVAVPSEIETKLGAGSLSAKYTKLKLENYKLDVGAGSADIEITPDSLPNKADFNIGAGKIALKLSKESGLKVNYAVGLGVLKIADREFHGNGSFNTDNYSNASKQTELTIKIGAGEATIEFI
jgi:hypothetical protein